MATYKQNSANYYFEYKMELIDNNLPEFKVDTDNMPKVYLEKDYGNSDINYELFLVFPDWLEPKENLKLEFLPYDKVIVHFDIKGVDCSSIKSRLSTTSREEVDNVEKKNLVMPFDKELYSNSNEDYKESKYRMGIISGETDFSGAGVIELYSTRFPNKSATFHFVTNFMYKKRIVYSLIRDKKDIVITIKQNDLPEGIKLQLLHRSDRFPCLLSDTSGSTDLDIEFKNGKSKFVLKDDYPNDLYTLAFKNVVSDDNPYFGNFEKYFVLECEKNNTISVNDKPVTVKYESRCPYCHELIEIKSKAGAKGYHKGGISCRGNFAYKNARSIEILGTNNRPVKESIFCENDVNQMKDPNGAIVETLFTNHRLLPKNYLSRENVKVAVLGSARAGKSTYLSRLFDVVAEYTGNEQFETVNFNGRTIRNVCSKLYGKKKLFVNPLTIESYNIPLLEDKGDTFKLTTKSWYNSEEVVQYYGNYSIGLGEGKRYYPKPTERGEETSGYPFILNVNSNNYVSFYDIAGENAEKGDQVDKEVLAKISTGSAVGIFCIINGEKSADANERVIKTIKENFRNENCPIAVILSKFDRIQNVFDPNCFCLRDDYLDVPLNKYSGSYLEHVINNSSEEIKAYLKNSKLDPGFEKNPAIKEVDEDKFYGFKNVKYFNVSSFSFMDALYHESQDKKKGTNEINYLKFDCSPKRIELPLIWMLKQFGIIV